VGQNDGAPFPPSFRVALEDSRLGVKGRVEQVKEESGRESDNQPTILVGLCLFNFNYTATPNKLATNFACSIESLPPNLKKPDTWFAKRA
jgi:hypothetical protein